MLKNYLVPFLLMILSACGSNSDKDTENVTDENSSASTQGSNTSQTSSNSDCGYSDGSHSATVEYNNPDTGYDATYTLDVQVEGCEVIEIDFPKGGYLNNDHISPTELDSNGDASITDDRGRSFEVHIDD